MKSLPANLATHPYEHRQWVRRVTLVSAAVVAVLTLAHLALAFSLRDQPQSNEPDRAAIELLRQWDEEVDDLVGAADPEMARRLSIAVGLSNGIIEQRVFPWGGRLPPQHQRGCHTLMPAETRRSWRGPVC